jgi:hypothetical protein
MLAMALIALSHRILRCQLIGAEQTLTPSLPRTRCRRSFAECWIWNVRS